MLRNSAILIILMLSVTILATGCSTPTDPVEMTYGGNAQSDDGPYVPPPPTPGVDLGDVAPDFTLQDTYGDDFTLSALDTGPVLLFFWATGCQYCEEQYPIMQDYHETYSGSLTVISVNIGDDPQLINAFMADRGLTFPCLVADSTMQSAYEVNSVPHALIIDSEGLVSFNDHPGYLTETFLQDEF